MTDSSVLASTLILRVGVLASQSYQVAQQTTQISLDVKQINLMKIILYVIFAKLFVKNNFWYYFIVNSSTY